LGWAPGKGRGFVQMYYALKKGGQMGKKEESQETLYQRVIAEYQKLYGRRIT